MSTTPATWRNRLRWSELKQEEIMKIVLINPNRIPYNLSPANYSNSPINYSNSPSNSSNSEINYSNSPINFSNSRTNYSNGPSGTNRFIIGNGRYAGYYVNNGSTINFFNSAGKRIVFNPAGSTDSLIHTSKPEWCGTLFSMNGKRVVGLLASYYHLF